jgi:hypothetical protein
MKKKLSFNFILFEDSSFCSSSRPDDGREST